MNSEFILEQFSKGFDCSQIVLAEVAGNYGLDSETARRVAACFGGGMWCAGCCGALTGAFMAVGLKYGHAAPYETDKKDKALTVMGELRKKFTDKYQSTECKDILGHDLSIPEEMQQILDKGLIANLCPNVISNTVEILNRYLENR
ncbi:MAG: C-GCAxxG-C-C family protein [Tannerellaceae bacterium]|jgi:C_GCAxxG_C_C family probable redox protein|nr:C-GCAxxG-C-C family protein [Tannerellaceae bacterium]